MIHLLVTVAVSVFFDLVVVSRVELLYHSPRRFCLEQLDANDVGPLSARSGTKSVELPPVELSLPNLFNNFHKYNDWSVYC